MSQLNLYEEIRHLLEELREARPTIAIGEDFPWGFDMSFPARIVQTPFVRPGEMLIFSDAGIFRFESLE